MRIILLTILLFNCLAELNAQQWALREGGQDYDQGRSICADKNGHIYATGFFSSTSNFGNTTLSSAGNYDGYLTKYDTSGTLIWAKRFGGIGSDYPKHISIDNDHNIVVAGSIKLSNTITIDTITITTNNNQNNYFVAKFDTDGNVIWAIAGEGYLDFYDVAINRQNQINLIGTMGGTCIFGTDTIIPYYEATMGHLFHSWDIILVQYTSAGILNWAKKAGGHGTDYGYSITSDDNDNLFITGGIEKEGYFDTIQQVTFNNSYDRTDAFIAKMTSSGDFVWVNTFGANLSSAHGEQIKFNNDQLFFAGRFTKSVNLNGDTIHGNAESFISKLDTNTNVLWSTKSGGRYIMDMQIDQHENALITGVFRDTSIFGADTLITTPRYDTYTSKIDSNGNFIWTKYGGGIKDDFSLSLCLDGNDNTYITGTFNYTASFGAFSLNAVPGHADEIFIVKYGANGLLNGIHEEAYQTITKIDIYPNPFSSSITIKSMDNFKDASLIIENCFGQTIKRVEHISGNTISLNGEDFANGLYLLRLTEDQRVITTSKLIKVD